MGKRHKGPRFYAVRVGHHPGIYNSWDKCEKQVKGFPGAVHMSFGTHTEAFKFAFPNEDISNAEQYRTYTSPILIKPSNIPALNCEVLKARSTNQITVKKKYEEKKETEEFDDMPKDISSDEQYRTYTTPILIKPSNIPALNCEELKARSTNQIIVKKEYEQKNGTEEFDDMPKDIKDKLTLFVKNLPEDVSEYDIEDHFYGCAAVKMPTKPDGSNRGFAFVYYSEISQVEEALTKYQGSDLEGSALLVEYSGANNQNIAPKKDTGRSESKKSSTLYVGNLSFDTGRDVLESAFDGCKSAHVATYRDTGKSRGFGFVDFDSKSAAEAALIYMDGQKIDGRFIHLDYAHPRPRGGGRGGRFRASHGGGSRKWRDGGSRVFQKKDSIRDLQGKRKSYDD